MASARKASLLRRLRRRLGFSRGDDRSCGGGATDDGQSPASRYLVFAEVDKVLRQAVIHARRVLVFVVGASVVLIGVIMFVTPGPAVIVIPLGLGILAIEFAWARILLARFRARAGSMGRELRAMMSKSSATSSAPDRRKSPDDTA